jgi:hypothetical protein
LWCHFFGIVFGIHLVFLVYFSLAQFSKLLFLQVARLYRKSLKVLSSWAIDRDIINDEATKIRSQFDAERGCKPERALRLMRVSVIVKR